MIGAIAGDIIGSPYEGILMVDPDFPLFGPGSRFTDDTVLTVAVASAIRQRGDFATALRQWGRRYPHAGYGGFFRDWLRRDDAGPYNSFGNGSAMRVAPIGWAFDDPDAVLREAARSAEVTHNHPEGVKGAQAVAATVHAARTGGTRETIAALLSDRFGYDCPMDLSAVRRGVFDVTCQGTVPAAATAFLCSTDFESAVRNAVALGGDTDTLGCIAGALAEAFYGGVPSSIREDVFRRLDERLGVEVVAFAEEFGVP